WHVVGHRRTPHPGPPPQGGREPRKPSPLVGEGWVGGRGKTMANACQDLLPHPQPGIPVFSETSGREIGYLARSRLTASVLLPRTSSLLSETGSPSDSLRPKT